MPMKRKKKSLLEKKPYATTSSGFQTTKTSWVVSVNLQRTHNKSLIISPSGLGGVTRCGNIKEYPNPSTNSQPLLVLVLDLQI